MKLLWWKIYLWINIAILAFAAIAEISYPTAPVGLFIADMVLYTIGVIGVYAYIFKKEIFEPRFWKYYFWFIVIYTALFVVYAVAPNDPVISNLSFLAYSESTDDLFITSIVGSILSLPYMYGVYQLSKGKFFEPPTLLEESKKARWGMVQTALWGYSFVFIFVLMILSLFSTSDTPSTSSSSDSYSSIVIFAPILIFWVWIAVQYKRYTWNWWKITLILNSLLFSSLIVFGSFFYEPSSMGASDEFDVIGLLQTLIIFTGLYVFGREQLHPVAQPSTELKPKTKKIKPEGEANTVE